MAIFKAVGRNVPYLKQQFIALLGNTSTSVKFICAVVIFSYCLSYSEEAVNVLSVTPEVHFWEVLVDIVTVGLCGKLIEPLWGQMEMMTFFAIVNLGVAIISTAFYFILYMWTFNVDLLFTAHIHGLAGYIAGVSVAVKQIMPDLVLIKTPLGKLSNKNVPLLVFFMSLVLWIIGLLEGTYPTMFLSGLLVSWIYLRFYQWHSNGSRGDMADYFTFASFFPNVIQPPIAVVSNTIYGTFVNMGICRKVVRRFDIANPTGVTISIPGNDQHDMERRRQIALKALSERLSKSHAQDKQLLIPKSNLKVPIASVMQGAGPSSPQASFKPPTIPSTLPPQTILTFSQVFILKKYVYILFEFRHFFEIMDSQHLGTATPSKRLLNAVHNKFAHSTFSSESPFKRLTTHSTPPRYTKIRNPFENHLSERLHTHFFSPSVFKVSSPKVNEKFQWTIEEISSFYPADIDEAATDQYESHEHDSMMESNAQAKIDLYFSDDVAPSPFNQQIKSIPLISETETSSKEVKTTCDGVAQTMLSLPVNLPEELENALRPYFNQEHYNDIRDDISLHKKLFETEEIESIHGSIESSPPHSLVLSPIAPPNECDLESRFHSPFKLGDCNLSPIGTNISVANDGRNCASRLNFSGYMSVDSSLNVVPDVSDEMPKNESVNFDDTSSPQREILSDSTVNWDMEYKHIATDTPNKRREMDVSNSNTPKSKIFTSQRKKLSDSFLKEDEFSDKENDISIEEYNIDDVAYVNVTKMQDATDAGYHTGVLVSNDLSWKETVNNRAPVPQRTPNRQNISHR
ncbi:hypothetical protein Trydic_g12238 [Trypoxylus dichotomus]